MGERGAAMKPGEVSVGVYLAPTVQIFVAREGERRELARWCLHRGGADLSELWNQHRFPTNGTKYRPMFKSCDPDSSEESQGRNRRCTNPRISKEKIATADPTCSPNEPCLGVCRSHAERRVKGHGSKMPCREEWRTSLSCETSTGLAVASQRPGTERADGSGGEFRDVYAEVVARAAELRDQGKTHLEVCDEFRTRTRKLWRHPQQIVKLLRWFALDTLFLN